MIYKSSTPIVKSVRADNGEHSHFKLINVDNGETLWEEQDDDDKANGDYAVLCAVAVDQRQYLSRVSDLMDKGWWTEKERRAIMNIAHVIYNEFNVCKKIQRAIFFMRLILQQTRYFYYTLN